MGADFEAYEPIRAWLEEKKPDVLFVIFNDHVTSFFFDHYSQFALGIGDSYAVADEGGGPRPLPPVKGHTAMAHHIAAALVADEFDLSFFQDRPLDHGFFSPLCMMWPHEETAGRRKLFPCRWVCCRHRHHRRDAVTSSDNRCVKRSKAIRKICLWSS